MDVSNLDVYYPSFNRSVKNAEKVLSELKETKTGVKEVVDSGITQVPDIFVYPKQHQSTGPTTVTTTNDGHKEVPVIDLQGLQGKKRSKIVSEVRRASETWGMFQLINHGVPQETIRTLLEHIQDFNEQPKELKSEFYTLDVTKKVMYGLIPHPLYKIALWKDTLVCYFEDLCTEEIPYICRKPMLEYMKCVTKLKDILSELLSEALGLTSDYLKTMGCMEASHVAGHYSPACPEPRLVMATPKHSDPHFLTILVQNHIDALQVLHENEWIDVNFKEGAIIVNIGDMMQIMSNDIFKSAEHRVLARSIGPRLSFVCFFYPSSKHKDQDYGPIKELLKADNVPAFQETNYSKYCERFWQAEFNGVKPLSELRK